MKPKIKPFVCSCTPEQNKSTRKKLKAQKDLTGKSYIFIINEGLDKLGEAKK